MVQTQVDAAPKLVEPVPCHILDNFSGTGPKPIVMLTFLLFWVDICLGVKFQGWAIGLLEKPPLEES